MAKPKYTITKNDFHNAKSWIRNNYLDVPFAEWSAPVRKEELIKAKNEKTLNEWCEKYMDSDDWKRLKNALRAYRKRANDSEDLFKVKKQITLELNAWEILSAIARNEGITMSAAIEKHLTRVYNKISIQDEEAID